MSTQSFWRRPLRWLATAAAVATTFAAFSQGAAAQTAICYNCPPRSEEHTSELQSH